MSHSTVLIDRKNFQALEYTEDHKEVVVQKPLIKSKRNGVLRLKIYRQIVNTIISVLMIFACLSVYEVTGLHDLWIQLVGQITSLPY